MTAVHGCFSSPTGGTGSFRGAYVLEHLLARSGRVAVRGVFTGELSGGDGERVGVAARRQTTPVQMSAVDGCLLARIDGLDVDLNGLVVAVDPLVVHLEGTRVERAARAALRLPPLAEALS